MHCAPSLLVERYNVLMNFSTYFIETSPTRRAYILDAGNDFIGSTMKTVPVVANCAEPFIRPEVSMSAPLVWMSVWTLVLLYNLHKLGIRPE